MEKLELGISGMSCGHCVAAVKEALQELEGVEVEQVAVGSARLSYDPARRSVDDILDAVSDAGYQAERAGGAGSAA